MRYCHCRDAAGSECDELSQEACSSLLRALPAIYGQCLKSPGPDRCATFSALSWHAVPDAHQHRVHFFGQSPFRYALVALTQRGADRLAFLTNGALALWYSRTPVGKAIAFSCTVVSTSTTVSEATKTVRIAIPTWIVRPNMNLHPASPMHFRNRVICDGSIGNRC